MEQQVLRKCTKCGKYKPATLEFWHKAAKVKSGLSARCIQCVTGHPTRQVTPGLHLGETRSERNKRQREARKQTLKGYFSDTLWNSIRARHKRITGGESDLTVTHLLELWERQNGRCYWLDTPMTWGVQSSDAHPTKVSLDRLEPGLGYMQGNVVLACNFANRGRGNMPADEFRTFLNHHFRV